MNKVLIKTMLRNKIFSVFLTGLVLVFLFGTFFYCYSFLKTIYVINELTDQNFNNKEAVLSQTARSNQDKENLSPPGEIAAPQASSERVEKALLSVDSVAYDSQTDAINSNDLSVSTDPETKRITISKRHDNTIAEQSQSRQEMARFLAREADYISKAKRSIKQPTQKERDALFNDPLTGKPWHEVDQEIGLSPKPNRASKPLSEAEFLAAESAYIEQAKQAVKDTPKSRPDGDNIDPISGKSWDEIESEL